MSMPQTASRALVAAMAVALVLSACRAADPDGSPRVSARASVPASSSAPASQPGSTIPPLDSGPDALALEPFVTGLDAPIGITNSGDGTGRLFVNATQPMDGGQCPPYFTLRDRRGAVRRAVFTLRHNGTLSLRESS